MRKGVKLPLWKTGVDIADFFLLLLKIQSSRTTFSPIFDIWYT